MYGCLAGHKGEPRLALITAAGGAGLLPVSAICWLLVSGSEDCATLEPGNNSISLPGLIYGNRKHVDWNVCWARMWETR